MDKIKELFEKAENGTLTYSQFESAVKGAGIKLADLSTGDYVAKAKYDADIQSRDGQISTLNDTISQRDTDLANIQTQLTEAGEDKTKLTDLNTQLTALQTKYEADVKEYQSKLSKQSYEFAVKEFAGSKQFTSKAAKRDFVNAMINKGLQMDGDKILGAEDFVASYTAENDDAFVKEEPSKPNPKKPAIVAPTGGETDPGSKNPFQFSFTGVRSHNDNK